MATAAASPAAEACTLDAALRVDMASLAGRRVASMVEAQRAVAAASTAEVAVSTVAAVDMAAAVTAKRSR
jgi:hypothetical protein